MNANEWVLLIGVLATLLTSLAGLIHGLTSGRKKTFVATVTAQRIKWIGKVRANIARIFSLFEVCAATPAYENSPRQRAIEELVLKTRLQLNIGDPEDERLNELLKQLPIWDSPISREQFAGLKDEILFTTQVMLKREWEKVKDESLYGDLRPDRRWWRWSVATGKKPAKIVTTPTPTPVTATIP